MVEDERLSDEDLRELRREALAHPGDPRCLRALAAAQERAGDRRGAFLALCELARTGDHAAQQRVLGWSPWSDHGHAGSAQRARRAGIAGAPRLSLSRAPGHGGQLWVASDLLVYALDARGRPAALAHDLTPAWSHTGDELDDPRYLFLELCGDDVVCAAHERLYLFDGARGALKAEAPCPPRLADWAVQGDRLLVLGEADEEEGQPACTLAIDLGARFGRVIWSDEGTVASLGPDAFPSGLRRASRARGQEVDVAVRLGGAWAWIGRSDPGRAGAYEDMGYFQACAARRLETGVEYALEGLLEPARGDRALRFAGADEQGVVLGAGEPGRLFSDLFEVSASTGRRRWYSTAAGELLAPAVGLGADVMVLAGLDAERDAVGLIALDRADGRARWRVSVPCQAAHPHVVLADDVLYVSLGGASPRILGIDLCSGQLRFEVDLEPARGCEVVRLVALERALLFECNGPAGETLRGRLE